MNDTAIRGGGLPEESEAIVRRFEAAWQGPEPPELIGFLPAGAPVPTRLLFELVHVDLDLRLRSGQPARVETYLLTHPQLMRDRAALLDLIVAEFDLRRCWEAQADPEEYLRRFPQFARDLRNRIGIDPGQGIWRRPVQTRPWVDGPVARPAVPGYEVLRELGRGGMGVVYQARQVALGRLVALKTILPGYSSSSKEIGRFRREAEAIALLDHPHVVPIYEVGEHAGRPYFSMKFYPGRSLAHELNGPSVNPKAHAQLVETIARAIHHAHQRGILHRDLKPANILLDDSGLPHVADFGLAKWFDPEASTIPGSGAVGTPGYSAPEQARGNQGVTAASDVYGLGAILYELLTGEPPFRAETAMATLLQVMEDPPRRPSRLNPRIPAELELVCLKCLEKEPSGRYRSALELAEDLERWRNGVPIRARPVTRGEHAWRWARRHPVIAGLCAVTALALVLAVVTLAVSRVRIAAKEAETALALSRERQALGREQRLLYLERVASASRLWASNQVEAAERLLDQCPPSFRQSWEWRFLNSLRRPYLSNISHDSPITVVAYSPREGRYLASAGTGGLVMLHDAASGHILPHPIHHGAWVTGLAFSADGAWLATADLGAVKVWDIATRKELFRLPGSFWAAFSPDGRHLATAVGGTVKIWEARAGRELHSLAADVKVVRHGVFSADGRRLAAGGLNDRASGDRGSVLLWDVASGRRVGEPRKYNLPVHGLAIAPCGKQLLVLQPTAILLTDVGTGRVHSRIDKMVHYRTRIPVSPDGRYFAFADPDHTVRVWDLHAWREVFAFRGHAGDVTTLSFSPDGRRLASGGMDHTVKVWDLTRTYDVRALDPMGRMTGGVVLSPDGRGLAVTLGRSDRAVDERGEVLILEPVTGRLIRRLRGTNDAAYGPDGSWLATGSPEGGLTLWDVETGKARRTLRDGRHYCLHLAISHNGSRVASGGVDGTIQVWDPHGGALIRSWFGHEGRVQGIALSPDGTLLASASEDGVSLWEVSTGMRIRRLGHSSAYAVAFSPDGKRIAWAGVDRVIHLCGVDTGQSMESLQGHTGGVREVAFSPDSQRLVSASTDGTVRLWDVESGRELISLPGITGEVIEVAFSPDGHQIVAADSQIKLWRAEPGTLQTPNRGAEQR